MRSRFAPRILLPLYTAAVIHCVCSALAGLYRLPSEIDYLLENIDLMYFLRELRMRNRTLKSLRKKGLEWLVSPCFGLLCMMLWYNYKLQWHTTALISRSFLVSEGQCSMGECHRARTLQPFTAWLEQRSSKSLWCETRNNCCWVPPSCWHRASFFFPLISSGYSCFYELGHQFSYSPESQNHYISIFLLSSWLLEQTTPSSDQPCRYGSPKIPWLRTCTFARSLPLARSFFDTAELCPSRSLAIIN